MEKHISLLVVLNQGDIPGFKEMIDALGEDFPLDLEIKFVTELRTALENLPSADWVMTDVFPIGNTGKNVVGAAIAAKKPIVWVSDNSYNHDHMLGLKQWSEGRGVRMFDLIDRSMFGVGKPWREALNGLILTALCIEHGKCFFDEDCIVGPVKPTTPFSGDPFGHVTHMPRQDYSETINEPWLSELETMFDMGILRLEDYDKFSQLAMSIHLARYFRRSKAIEQPNATE